MEKLIKSFILGTLSFVLIILVLFNDKSTSTFKSIIRPAINTKSYKLWTEVDGKDFCKSQDSNSSTSPYEILGKMVDSKIDIIYLTGIDVLSCNAYLEEISTKIHNYGLSIAIDIESNADTKKIFDENFTKFTPQSLVETLKDTKSATKWINYFVFENTDSLYTFEERRSIQSQLRDIYHNSFIGFRFENNIKPTPTNQHPIRNISWDNFVPKDDDGDFIITSIPVIGFKRTQVFTENLNLDGCDGEIIKPL